MLNTVAGRDSLIGLALQLNATYKLKQANQELVVVLREVQAAQGGITGTMGAAGGATQVAASKINRLQTAAKGAAGIAGLGAMAVGAGTTNDAVGTLVSTLGGAATGFAVGGPVGAAVGGLAGLFMGLASNTRDAGDAAKDTATDWAELADTLDQVTGAVTDQTRAQLYEKLASDGTLDTLAKLGVTRREVISAIQGQKGALSDLNGTLAEQQVKLGVEQGQLDQLYAARQRDQAAIAVGHTLSVKDAQALVERTHARDAEIASLEESTAATRTSIESTQGAIETIKEHRREILLRSRDTADYAGKLKGLPKEARTQIKADGVIPTTRAIAKLANKYNLTPKQIKTLIEATGTETTARKVAKVQAALRKVNDTKPDLTRFSTGTNKFMTDLAPKVKTSAGKVGKAAKEGVQQGAKGVNLNGYKSDVTQGVNKAKSAASTGGNQVGTALKTGTMAGVSGLMSQLSGAVAAAVNAAVAAGKRAARAKSPSKRMYELGTDIGDGLVLGVNAKQGAAAKAGKDLVDKLFGGNAISGEDIKSGLTKVTELVKKTTDKRIKDDKKAAKAAERILDDLHKRFKLLKANAKAQRENTAELERAKGVYSDLVAKAEAVRATFVSFGDITQLGRLDSGKVSLTKLLAQLRQRAADAREFNALIHRLAAMGLTQAQINQLVEAGPEQALATARAIA